MYHWPELGLMATPGCKGGWDIEHFAFQAL